MPEARLVTTSTGVRFRAAEVSQWAITAINRQMEVSKPRPPKFHNADFDRDEENPNDPAYLDALSDWQVDRWERILELAILTALKIDEIPEGVQRPLDDEWRENLAMAGIELSDNPKRRLIEWVKYVAAPSNDDWFELAGLARRTIGTDEGDVAAATETFRSDPSGGTDNGSPVEEHGSDGDRIWDPTPGFSADVRGTGGGTV